MKPLTEDQQLSPGFFLLQERTEPDYVKTIINDDKKNSIVVYETILQDYRPNRNKRKYGRKLLESALNSDVIKEKIATKSFFGEANHPFDNNIRRQMSVDQTRITHIVTSVNIDPKTDYITGVVETAATTAGADMYGLITKNNVKVAHSMRGVGKVIPDPTGINEVHNPFLIVGYDWVVYPSHSSAYMKKIINVNESAGLIDFNGAEIYADEGKPYTGLSPVSESEIKDFIQEFSNTYKSVKDFYGLNESHVYSIDENSIIMEDTLTSLKIFLEKPVKKEIAKVLRKLK